nr:unnamed protein product [Spirometra erinaceieuropaei]
MALFTVACGNFGLDTNIAKTVVHQPPRYAAYKAPQIKMQKAVILPTLLYGAETWTVYMKQAQRLNHFNPSRLRRIVKFMLQDRIPDTDVLERTGTLKIYAMLKQPQMRWSGYIVRMDYEWLPKRLFCGGVVTGGCREGGKVCRYKDALKTSPKRL